MDPAVLTRKDVAHVAALAQLTLSDEETERLTRELGTIVAYVKELEAVDTTDVPPTAHIDHAGGDITAAWRPDEPAPGLSRDEALAGAPHAGELGFAVPAFVEV